MRKVIFIIITFMMIITVVYANEKIQVKYIKTSDGDTARFELNGENVRIRFLGINTPEVAGEDKVEEPYGNEALAYTRNKLENATKIEIEYDDNADKEDRFGRPLAYIWVDGKLFQEELVRNGYAKTYMMKANYKYADELKSAERQAKAEKVGVWSDEVTSEKNTMIEDSTEEIHYSNEEKTENETGKYEDDSIIISPFIVIILALIALALFFSSNKRKKGG